MSESEEIVTTLRTHWPAAADRMQELEATNAELLEALEWVIGYGCPEKVEKRISAAIAKARGGE